MPLSFSISYTKTKYTILVQILTRTNYPNSLLNNNLHGVDLDDRAIQLAQLGLWIKAKQKRRSTGSLKFNVESSDFFLPKYTEE